MSSPRLIDDSKPLVWTVDALLDARECTELVSRAESAPREIASVGYASGARVDPAVRDNERVTFEDDALEAMLWARARAHVAPAWPDACGVNERLRFYVYRPGQRFAMHRDGIVAPGDGRHSVLTYLVYLDDACEGGETHFPRPGVTIAPRCGTALFFQHALLHEGRPVMSGVKHVLRTDVMVRA